jgi:hypothetical protein
MLKIQIGLLFIMTAGIALSQTNISRFQEGQGNEQSVQIQSLYYEALRVFSAEAEQARPNTEPLPLKCALELCHAVRRHFDLFNAEQQAALRPLISRPKLPSSYVSSQGRFRIHFTTAGLNKVPKEDSDFSGIPDFIEEAARSLEFAYKILIDQLGYNPPPDDRGVDGPEWDVYLTDIPGSYGWTDTEYRISRAPDIYTSYIRMDNDYAHTPTRGLDGLRVTTAHEFFHMVQLGYNGRDEDDDGEFDDVFLMEAASTWVEDEVYDSINDYYHYLPAFFNQTNIPFNYTNGSREYGLGLFFHFLEKRFGGQEAIRRVWEYIVEYPAIEAIDVTLEELGVSFNQELSVFYGWNVMTGSRADTLRFYPEGLSYPELKFDGLCRFLQDTALTISVCPISARYFRFDLDNNKAFILIPTYTERDPRTETGNCTFLLEKGSSHPSYIDLDNRFRTRLVAEDYARWKGCVVIINDPSESELLTFNASRYGFDEQNLPASFPSPFVLTNHSHTTIPFFLEHPDVVNILIFSSAGYIIVEREKYYEKGLQTFNWTGNDDSGNQVATGIYIYLVTAGGDMIRKEKIAVVR